MRGIVILTIGSLLIAGLVGISQFHWKWYWIIPLFCAGVLLNYWSDRLETAAQRKTVNQTTSKRQSFTSDAFVAKHFTPEQANIAETVLEVFGQIEGIDWKRVHPDDHFTGDLGMDQSDLMFSLHDLHKHYGVELPPQAVDHLVNIRSVVEWISSERHQ